MKLSRPLPTFGALMILEVTLCLGIISIAIACIMPNLDIATKKAQISQLFYLFVDAKVDRMVNMALSGEGYFPESSPPKISEKTKSMPMIDGVDVHEVAIGNVVRYEGRLGEPFYLTFAPSVITEGPIGTVLWLCGNKKPPLGWTQPTSTGTDLPSEAIPFVCRDL
jgi:hypothetical protein